MKITITTDDGEVLDQITQNEIGDLDFSLPAAELINTIKDCAKRDAALARVEGGSKE